MLALRRLIGGSVSPEEDTDKRPSTTGRWVECNSRPIEKDAKELWMRAKRLTVASKIPKRGSRVFGTQAEDGEQEDIVSQLNDERRVKTNAVDVTDPFLDYNKRILNPLYDRYRRWDAVMTFTCLASCVVTPANLSFGANGVQDIPTLCFDVAVCAFIMSNVAIRSMTAVHDVHSQSFLLRKQGIRRNKLVLFASLPWFVPHCIATLMVSDVNRVKQLKVIRLLDLSRLVVAAQSNFVKHILSVHSKRVALMYRLASISILFWMMAHWGACTVWFAGRYTELDDSSWLGQLCRLRNEEYLCIRDGWRGYLHSLSYAVSVVSTVRYSPFVAVTDEETALAAVGSIIGMFMNGYVIANIMEIISESQREQRRYQTIVEKLRYYAERYSLPDELYADMLGHVNYQWELHKYEDDGEILQKLSRNLRVRASLFVCGTLITKVPIFESAPLSMVSELVERLESCFATIDEVVCVQGEIGNAMFLISKGVVEVYSNRDDKHNHITFLGDGSYFGEISLVESSPRMASCRAARACDLFKLRREGFEQVMTFFPEQLDMIRRYAEERKRMAKVPAKRVARELININIATPRGSNGKGRLPPVHQKEERHAPAPFEEQPVK